MFLLMLFTDPEVSLFLWAAVATVGEMFHMEPWISKPVLGGGFSFLNEFLFFFLLLINYRGLKFSEVFTVCVATLVKSHKSYYTWQTIDLGKLCQAIWRKKKISCKVKDTYLIRCDFSSGNLKCQLLASISWHWRLGRLKPVHVRI